MTDEKYDRYPAGRLSDRVELLTSAIDHRPSPIGDALSLARISLSNVRLPHALHAESALRSAA